MDRRHVFLAAAAATGLLALQSPAARADGWAGSWGASDVFPVGPDVNYQTLRQFVRLSAGGTRLRVRFSNATGQYPLVIGAAHVAKPAADGAPGAIDPSADHALTFGGAKGVTVPPGAEVVSDPVEMDLPALSTVAVSLFVPRFTGPAVIHLDGVATTYISDNGDFTGAASMPKPHTSTSRFFLDEVDVEAAGPSGALVTLGDSITDGYHSKVDGNHRWPDGWRSAWRRARAKRRSASSTPASAATASCTTTPRICSARTRWRGSTGTFSRRPA